MLKIKRLLITALILVSVATFTSCKKKDTTPTSPDDDAPGIVTPQTPTLPSDDTPSEPSKPSDETPTTPTTPTEPDPSTPTEPEPTDPVTPTDPTTPVEPDPTKPEPTEPEAEPDKDIVLPETDTSNATLTTNNIYDDAFYSFTTKATADFNYTPENATAVWSLNKETNDITYTYTSTSGTLNFAFINQGLEGSKIYSADGLYYVVVDDGYDKFTSTNARTHSTNATVTFKEENGIYSGEFSLVVELAVRLIRNSNFTVKPTIGTGATLTMVYRGAFTDKTINYSFTYNLKDKITTTNDVETVLTMSSDGQIVKDTPVITIDGINIAFDLSLASSSNMTWTTDASKTTMQIQDSDVTYESLAFDITFTQKSIAIVLDDKDVYGSGELKGIIQKTS